MHALPTGDLSTHSSNMSDVCYIGASNCRPFASTSHPGRCTCAEPVITLGNE